MAPFRRARRHVCGNLEIGEPGPYTGLVHAEDRKVLGLDGRDVGFVGDGKSTSGQIVKALEQKKVRQSILAEGTAGELTVAVTIVSHGGPSTGVRKGLTVNGGQGGVWTRIISLPDIAPLGRVPVGGRALVTGDLGCGRFTSRELEEITRVGWMVEMAVEPPLVKSVIGQRSHGPVIVGVGLGGDVETIHARMVNCCKQSTPNLRGKGNLVY